eukprot:GHVR01173313.1.p1 GENE.GHVR01173313.1~~GHVR01173313.1.p1  ORF type:complete len:119 (+),score=12.21 GHVR01173313.1:1059-1415(+)
MHFTEKLHIIGDEIFFRMSIGNRCSNGTGNKVAEVQKLVSYKGCDTCKDKDGTNSLVVETKNKDRVVLLKLLIEGSDVNTVSKDGVTALMYASINGNLEVVKLLIEKGADVIAKDGVS